MAYLKINRYPSTFICNLYHKYQFLISIYLSIYQNLHVIRFKDAEIDCTEALNLDDRYVKAYSRRATARKELGKLKEAMEGASSFP
jgi:hypothetical protein